MDILAELWLPSFLNEGTDGGRCGAAEISDYSDSELAGVLLREVRRSTLCQLSLTLGLHAYQSLLMIFIPVDAHSQ